MAFQDHCYFFIVKSIKCCKWIEYKILKLFKSRVTTKVLQTFASVGVIVNIAEENHSRKQIVEFNKNYVSEKSQFKKLFELKINDHEFFARVASNISLGLGEGYMDGMWDSNKISEIIKRVYITNTISKHLESHPWSTFLNKMEQNFSNLRTTKNVWEVGKKHYDLGNDLFQSFLDPWMNYSSGYWPNANNLKDAQVHKMQLIADKLLLKRDMSVLDIGCGWGGLCKFLAKKYGTKCVGITISKEQATYGTESCKELAVQIRLEDYKDLNQKFDRIVSVEMLEHVGIKNFQKYFQVVHRCLKDDGIFILQCTGINHTNMQQNDPWFNKYLWPNYCLPYSKDITKYTKGLFVIKNWHNFGSSDCAKTFQFWFHNFNRNWPTISSKYGDKFYRMWTFYLQTCDGIMQSRMTQTWQIVFSKDDCAPP